MDIPLPIAEDWRIPFLFQPWKIALAVLGEFVRMEQEKVIEYLQLENQILCEKIGGTRGWLSDDQRRLLAVKGKALGRQSLEKMATVAQADTILRWHRGVRSGHVGDLHSSYRSSSRPTATTNPARKHLISRHSTRCLNAVLLECVRWSCHGTQEDADFTGQSPSLRAGAARGG